MLRGGTANRKPMPTGWGCEMGATEQGKEEEKEEEEDTN